MAITVVHDCDIERRVDPTAEGGDFRDADMSEANPYHCDGFGLDASSGVYNPGGKGEEVLLHSIVLFDLTKFIPASAVITAAVWLFYVNITTAAAGHSFRVDRCLRTNWREYDPLDNYRGVSWMESSWGILWTTPGGDWDQTVTDHLGALDTTGWKAISVINNVSDAWTNRSGLCTFILHRDDGLMTVEGWCNFRTKEYRDTDPTLVHHLRITYTLADRTFQVMVR